MLSFDFTVFSQYSLPIYLTWMNMECPDTVLGSDSLVYPL